MRAAALRILATIVLSGLLLVGAAGPALAQAAPESVNTVLNNLRLWVMGILAALATLYLTVAGVRYMIASGDPAQIEKAKSGLRSAALGYALAALSPVIFAILKQAIGQ